MHAASSSHCAVPPDWSGVETVCLDMDGTVLDLHFDNLFWLQVLPQRWGESRGMDAHEALSILKPRFDAKHGTLDWYCVDHWSEELGFDVAGLKHELRGHIRYLPGAVECLDRLRARGLRVLLTTNAHPISLGIKSAQTGLARHFDAIISSHEFGVPKESPAFWQRLELQHGVVPGTTLFVDDSVVVLSAARTAGVRWIYQVLRPDSTQPVRDVAPGFTGIERLADIVP